MNTMTTRVVALAGALTISLGAAACSKSETPTNGATGQACSQSAATSTTTTQAQAPTAGEVLEKAKTNALAATSGAFAGDVEDEGKKMTIDFKGTSDGKTADITIAAVTPDQVASGVTEETVNGIDCWVITDTKGKAEGALYVSKDGFEVVRFTGSAKSPGQLDFSKWNEDLGIKAPDASQVLTLP